MKYYFVLLIMSQSIYLLGQNVNISPQESESFVKILLSNRYNQDAYEEKIIEALDATGMSIERYATIVRSGFNGEKEVITANEQITMEKIKFIKIQEESDRKKRLSTLCYVEKMAITRYEELYQRYQKDIEFQQALLPIIQSQIVEK